MKSSVRSVHTELVGQPAILAPAKNYRGYGVWIGYLLFCAAVLFANFLLPMRHDYEEYASQWQWMLGGGNPYFRDDGTFTGNAYGPVHVLLSMAYWLHPLLPRAFFVGAWLLLAGFIWRQAHLQPAAADTKSLNRWRKIFLIAFLFLNPIFWVFTLAAGTHDTLIALSCVAAIWAVQQKRPGAAGVFLGLGTLLKFIPVLIVPFLALSAARRVRWPLVLAFGFTVALGFGVAMALWGTTVFEPLLFASGRDSKMLSIFRFLRGSFSPLQVFTRNPNVDWLSLPCMALGHGALLLYYLRTRARPTLIASLGLFIPFLFYKVGHQQFYTVLFFLIPLWAVQETKTPRAQLVMLVKATSPLAWIAFTALVYAATKGYKPPFEWIREVVGLPTFLLSAYGIAHLLRWGFLHRPAAATSAQPADSQPVEMNRPRNTAAAV